jgi:hypothetical protein
MQNIQFVRVVVFEKRFEAIVDGNAYAYTYERPCHKDSRRNSSVVKIDKYSNNDVTKFNPYEFKSNKKCI